MPIAPAEEWGQANQTAVFVKTGDAQLSPFQGTGIAPTS